MSSTIVTVRNNGPHYYYVATAANDIRFERTRRRFACGVTMKINTDRDVVHRKTWIILYICSCGRSAFETRFYLNANVFGVVIIIIYLEKKKVM